MALRRDERTSPPAPAATDPAGTSPGRTVPPGAAAPSLRPSGVPSPATPLPHTTSRATRLVLRLVLLLFGPFVRLEGGHRLDGLPEPVIFAFNHNNSIESVVVPAVLMARRRGRTIRFAVDWMFLHLPLVGWLLRRVDPVPVYTKPFRWRLFEGYRQARRHRSPVEGCRRALEAGASVGLFPEGTRNRDPRRLRRGRSGLGHLVLDGPPVPVVPVGIDYPAKARLGRIPRLGRTVVRVGAPLDFAAERRTAASESGAVPAALRRRLARRVVARVMRELAVLGRKDTPETATVSHPSPAGDAAASAGRSQGRSLSVEVP